ncbi:hypothetical protein Q3V30_12160 [Erwinia pyri]|uniref:Uncharacterized protein n=1 Tax=Erwinia pyri TaxID=3062598 RepID=A0AA50DFM9_9GAMM|nr:hypothetical protein [Erwinia sp. DE2]WLS77245.1 hypothetical protein Q3V30_12160 [Erwinia sp. DE2]
MNSLLVKAGIPQLRVSGVAGGKMPCRFVYVAKIAGQETFNNYQYDLPRVDVESFWKKFNDLARGKA